MLHVIGARCVARDLHTIAPGPLERTCWRRFAVQWDCKKSRNVPLNEITIIIIIIIIVTIITIILYNGYVVHQTNKS